MFSYMKKCVLEDKNSSQNEIKMWEAMQPLDCFYSAKILLKFISNSDSKKEYNGKHVDLFDVKDQYE